MILHVENMTCGGCARAVGKAITRVDAQARVEADPPRRRVSVQTSAAPADILKALDDAGFSAIAA